MNLGGISMSAVYNSVLFKNLFGTEEMRKVFSEENLVQKWLDVESALARSEAKLGIIPREAAEEITKKSKVENMNLESMGKEITEISHPIVPMVRQLTDVCENGYGQYVHWGATTQDIMDSANVLQLKEVIVILERDIAAIQKALISLIENHKNVVMAGRTHGQQALPITFGYKVAVWLDEVNRSSNRLTEMKDRLLVGQFSGAVGTLASITEKGIELQEEIMKELDLNLPNISWHAARDNLAEFASFIGILGSTLGKIANEIFLLQKTEFNELEEPFKMGKVGSSTMPHKRNPSKVQNIVTVSRVLRQSIPIFLEGMIHHHERDMISWQTELESLPEICLLISQITSSSVDVLEGLHVNEERMRKNLDLTNGLIISESVMIKIGEEIGRQTSHDVIYDASMKAYEEAVPLLDALLDNEEIMLHIKEEELRNLFQVEKYVGYSETYADRVLKKTKEEFDL